VAQQPDGRFRRFLRTTPGWVLLLLLTIGVVFASWAYIQFVIAIPAVLLFGLGIPIWAGLKRPRFLALFGLACHHRDGDAGLPGEPLDRFGKTHPFGEHDEIEDVAVFAGGEVKPHRLLVIDEE